MSFWNFDPDTWSPEEIRQALGPTGLNPKPELRKKLEDRLVELEKKADEASKRYDQQVREFKKRSDKTTKELVQDVAEEVTEHAPKSAAHGAIGAAGGGLTIAGAKAVGVYTALSESGVAPTPEEVLSVVKQSGAWPQIQFWMLIVGIGVFGISLVCKVRKGLEE